MNKQSVIESGRAEFALNAVKAIKDDKNIAKHYKSYAKNFPTLVLTNGLAAAVAFVLEKSKGDGNEKKAYKLIYDNITSWLIKEKYFTDDKSLLEYVCSLNSDKYRVVTNEVLSLFEWLKRFASGLIEGEA